MSFEDAASSARQAVTLARDRPDEVALHLAQAIVELSNSMGDLARSLGRDMQALQKKVADIESDMVANR